MNDRQLQYKRLRHDVFGDTLLAGTKSKRGNKYAEVFVTKFSHEVLSLLFKRDGVSPKMIVDGLKEKTLGVFKRKVSRLAFT